jgi:hypothetical protein
MLHLVLSHFGPEEAVFNNFGMWAFLSIGAVSLFVIFIPLVTWMENRRKEHEAFYRAETFRRLAESSSEGAKAAIDMMREQDRLQRIKAREGMKVGGMVNMGVGIGLTILLYSLLGGGQGSPWLCGLIPGCIGVALFTYAVFLAPPIE